MPTGEARRARPVVFVLASYYLPGFRAGGPVRSLSNMIEALGDAFDFRVYTRDRDLGQAVPYALPEHDRDGVPVGKARVRYLAPSAAALGEIRREIGRVGPDLMYHNSFFDSLFTIAPLWLRRLGAIGRVPVLIAPRGEFSRGALGLKAPKKRGYLAVSRAFGVFSGLHWHATSEGEHRDILRMVGGRARGIWVAPNLGRPLPAGERPHRPTDGLAVTFISRISPMKNLLQAIRIVAACATPIRFDIYGPIGDEVYWRKCQEAMATAPAHVTVRHLGPIENERVPDVLRHYDAFLLPSLGENFGHAILEALSAGVPAVISDRTPWRGLRDAGAGFDLPLDDDGGFVAALEAIAARTPEEMQRGREAAHTFASRFHATDAVERTRAMLLAAMAGT